MPPDLKRRTGRRIDAAHRASFQAATNYPPPRRPPSAGSGPREPLSCSALVRAFDLVTDGVLFLDADMQVVQANEAVAGSTGYLRRELPGRSLADFLIDEPGRLRAAFDNLLRGDVDEQTLAARQRSGHGDALDVEVVLQVVETEPRPLIAAVVRRLACRDDAPAATQDERHDYLTALPTREAFEHRLRRAESRPRVAHGRFAVLFIDLDRFKRVNDAQGHRFGDGVLRTVGQRLSACIRPGDFVARYGGDEFVALLEDVADDDEVERIAERIRQALSSPVTIDGRHFRISASVGMAIGDGPSSARDLVHEADQAMYRAKRRARAPDRQRCAPG